MPTIENVLKSIEHYNLGREHTAKVASIYNELISLPDATQEQIDTVQIALDSLYARASEMEELYFQYVAENPEHKDVVFEKLGINVN